MSVAHCHWGTAHHPRHGSVVNHVVIFGGNFKEIIFFSRLIFSQAPAELKSATGQMLDYYLLYQPHLFEDTVEQMLERLQQEKEAHESTGSSSTSDGNNKKKVESTRKEEEEVSITLSRRMKEVRMKEVKVSVEDVMYMCVVQKFQALGIPLLPPLNQPYVDAPQGNLQLLTEGVHSKEAVELVREHLLGVMGPLGGDSSGIPLTAMVRMSKLQAAQVYAASIMFGYFLRQVDSRFQLDKALGTLGTGGSEIDQEVTGSAFADGADGNVDFLSRESTDDAVARLEQLFANSAIDDDGNPIASSSSPSSSSSGRKGGQGSEDAKMALRQYIQTFNQETLAATARLVSHEGASLVERQSTGLFGSVKELQEDMKDAVGQEHETLQDLVKKIEQAVNEGKVKSLTMSCGTQRRMVLEAVAYGAFLRDVETKVNREYDLLTPLQNSEGGFGPNSSGPGLLPPAL